MIDMSRTMVSVRTQVNTMQGPAIALLARIPCYIVTQEMDGGRGVATALREKLQGRIVSLTGSLVGVQKMAQAIGSAVSNNFMDESLLDPYGEYYVAAIGYVTGSSDDEIVLYADSPECQFTIEKE